MASSFASSLRALVRVIVVPAKRDAAAAALMARRAAGPDTPPPFSRASCRPATGSGTARAVSMLVGGAGGGPSPPPAVFEVVVQAGDGVGDCAGVFDVDEVMDAAAAACGVSLGDEGGAQVPVLDGQGDQPVGAAGDVPGQGPASPRTPCVRSCSCSDWPGGPCETVFVAFAVVCVMFPIVVRD